MYLHRPLHAAKVIIRLFITGSILYVMLVHQTSIQSFPSKHKKSYVIMYIKCLKFRAVLFVVSRNEILNICLVLADIFSNYSISKSMQPCLHQMVSKIN